MTRLTETIRSPMYIAEFLRRAHLDTRAQEGAKGEGSGDGVKLETGDCSQASPGDRGCGYGGLWPPAGRTLKQILLMKRHGTTDASYRPHVLG